MKHVHLHYSGKIKKVKSAVDKANEILGSSEFYEQIRAYKRFDSSTLSPEVISRLMQESGHRIEVRVNWIVPNIKTKHDRICLSGWEFSAKLGTGVNNLIHETVNCMDNLYDMMNSEKEARNYGQHTAPWVIGAIAEIMVKST